MKNLFHQLIYHNINSLKLNKNGQDTLTLIEIILPPLLLSTFIYLSTFGKYATIVFTVFAIPMTVYIFDQYVYDGQQRKYSTNFFISWSITSFLILLYIFEFIVVPFLEITIWENYTLLSMVAIAIIMLIYLRKHSDDCSSNEVLILTNKHQNDHNNNDHDDNHQHQYDHYRNLPMNKYYCYWIGTSINGSINCQCLYMASHLFLIGALLFNAYLNLTTICHTYGIMNDSILIPDDCSEVYFDINLSLSFIAAIYACQLVILLSYSFIRLSFYIIGQLLTSNSNNNNNNKSFKIMTNRNNNSSNNCYSYHLLH